MPLCFCLCVCVGLHICNTMVSLHMKIWKRFCLKLQSRISNVYLSCPWMAEVLHHLGIRSLYFCCKYTYMSIYNYIHINIITFNTSEVALNFIHQQHHSRLFLCLPRPSAFSVLFTLEFQIHLWLFLSSRLPSCRIPSCWMDGIHAICLSTKKKVVTESLRRGNRRPDRSSSHFGLVIFWSFM